MIKARCLRMKHENIFNQCRLTRYWMRTCTSKYFMKLYQASLKKYDKQHSFTKANVDINKAFVMAKSIILIDALN